MADVEQQEQGEKPLSTADLLKSHTVKVVESHMASSYEQSAVDVCLEAVHKFKQYKDIASHVKHQFDKKYPGSGKATEGVFHCVCGKNFASKPSHSLSSLSTCLNTVQSQALLCLQLPSATKPDITYMSRSTPSILFCSSQKTIRSQYQRLKQAWQASTHCDRLLSQVAHHHQLLLQLAIK